MMGAMDGIGVPLLGAAVGFAAVIVCLNVPRLRRFALAALISPFVASLVFLVGLFMLADMNPAIEYGTQYTPTGREHDPTMFNNVLWLGSTGMTFVLSGVVCLKAQQIGVRIIQRVRSAR